MIHLAYAIIKSLLYPEVWILIGLVMGCLISWLRPCPYPIRWILFMTVVLYYALTTSPLTHALVWPMESYYHSPTEIPVNQDALVILGSDSPGRPDYGEPTIIGTGNVDLLVCGLVYAKAGAARKVVLTGGATGVFQRRTPGSVVMEKWAAVLGYPLESYERARALRQILGSGNRILLIDSAIHLRRSVAAFEKEGFIVTPIPCNYITTTDSWDLGDFVPSASNLGASAAAIHEYAGLLKYWISGQI
jgi:uncharacterized SAM-binding protein YcdF (DUF218 family)